MSSYQTKAKNPKTGKIETVMMIDDFYGKHAYGVQFEDGAVYPEEEIEFSKKYQDHFCPMNDGDDTCEYYEKGYKKGYYDGALGREEADLI